MSEQVISEFAGLSQIHQQNFRLAVLLARSKQAVDGFGCSLCHKSHIIVTAASDQGMVDIHDRKPLVLTPEHAREWIDPDTSPERAQEIATEHCRPATDFHWYKVGKDVGNVRNQGSHLIQPLSLTSDADD